MREVVAKARKRPLAMYTTLLFQASCSLGREVVPAAVEAFHGLALTQVTSQLRERERERERGREVGREGGRERGRGRDVERERGRERDAERDGKRERGKGRERGSSTKRVEAKEHRPKNTGSALLLPLPLPPSGQSRATWSPYTVDTVAIPRCP